MSECIELSANGQADFERLVTIIVDAIDRNTQALRDLQKINVDINERY